MIDVLTVLLHRSNIACNRIVIVFATTFFLISFILFVSLFSITFNAYIFALSPMNSVMNSRRCFHPSSNRYLIINTWIIIHVSLRIIIRVEFHDITLDIFSLIYSHIPKDISVSMYMILLIAIQRHYIIIVKFIV